MKFCSQCGGVVTVKIPPGDNRERFVCDACEIVHYQNPRMVVGCIPQWNDQILLCRRAIEPRLGFWSIPGGFMEHGEVAEEGAMREADEEVGIDIDIERVQAIYSVPHIGQVYLVFVATMNSDSVVLGPETLEARFFSEEEVPWDDMAFSAVKFSLRKFFEDRARGATQTHIGSFAKPDSEVDAGY